MSGALNLGIAISLRAAGGLAGSALCFLHQLGPDFSAIGKNHRDLPAADFHLDVVAVRRKQIWVHRHNKGQITQLPRSELRAEDVGGAG